MVKVLKRFRFIVKFWRSIPFLIEFFISKDVEMYKKIGGLLLIVAYAYFPFDMIPDFLYLIGIVDDVVIIGFILERMMKWAPPKLKDKYQLHD